MITIEHIDNAIKDAVNLKSNLTESQLAIGGFSTPTMRHLFNNLCNIEGTYLEVGLWMGGTFIASFNKNLISIGIENYSQDFSVVGVKEHLEKHIIENQDKTKYAYMIVGDCFNMDRSMLPNNIDMLFYDGHHDEQYQAKALPTFIDNMADKFLFIVDDLFWDSVTKGTTIGFEKLYDKILIEMAWILEGELKESDPVWHNGIGLFLISKK